MKKKLIILIALTLVFCLSLTLAACKKDKQYIAKFNANGGTVKLDGKDVDPEFGVTCSKVNEPLAEKEGYHLLGWYLDEKFTEEVPSWPYTLTKNTVFYAKWEADAPAGSYAVIFVTFGGSAVATQHTSVITTQPVTTKDNYSFVGWFDNDQCEGEPITFPYTVQYDMALYAKWAQGNGFTLTLVPNGGTSIAQMRNVSIAYESAMPTTTKTGYEFDGWYLDQELETPVTFPYTLTANTSFYAKWKSKDPSPEPETGTIVLVNAGNGATATLNGQAAVFHTHVSSGCPAVQGEVGAKLVLTTPTRVGSEFQGWYKTESFTGEPVTFPYTITGNEYFYGKWKITATPSQSSIAELTDYLNKTVPTNFAVGYGMMIQNSVGTVDNSYHYNYFVGNNVGSVTFEYDKVGFDELWVPAYVDWAFARSEDTGTYWMTYTQDDEGSYEYNNNFYVPKATDNLEEEFYMVYLSKLHMLNPAKFIKVGTGSNALWYAMEDYADTAGDLLLGNTSGIPSKYSSNYSELVLRFDDNGALVGISATSQVVDTFGVGTGTGLTYYYYHHTITINSIGADELAAFPSENDFTSDVNRPSGLYPTLNPADDNRNVATGDRAYTNAELRQALQNLSSFTSYYTLAGNTFEGIVYNPVTILTNGNVGKIVTNEYSYKMGEVTITQNAAADMYFVYNDELNAFFLIAPNTNNGYDIYCDQYSYKNNYYYNQYLLGITGNGRAILMNCKYPAVSVKYLDADKFTYNAEGKFFEYSDARTMTAAGQSLFGNIDLVYPEAGETETYVYLRVYMNNDKIAKVSAATQVQNFDESREFFIKELVITNYATPTVTLPAGVSDKCIVPGEAKVGGSVAALETAIAGTNAVNFTYTDRFVYDDYDELGGVFKDGATDKYVHYNGITRVTYYGDEYYYLYFKDGKLYAQRSTENKENEVNLSWVNNDVEKANEWLSWVYPISSLISADWFYEGKDGKFYGKQEYMGELSAALARYSGSETFLERDANIAFSNAYRWTVELDFVSAEVSSGKLMGFYYSGVILVKGSAGSHTKPFSGYATFSYEGTAVSMPVSSTPDATRPTLQHYLPANNSMSVTDLGIVSFTANENASGYKLYVYANGTAADPIKVIDNFTSGFDLKSISELNVQATPKTYYVSLQALGDGVSHLDGPLSTRMAVVLSTLPKLETPEVTISDGVITVGEVVNSSKFHWEVDLGLGNNNPQDVVVGGNTLDLKTLDVSWQEKKTYKIIITRNAQNSADYRDSDSVIVLYTPPKAEGTYIDDLFAPFDYSQSFNLTLTNQGITRNHWFNNGSPFDTETLLVGADKDLNAAADYRLVLKFWFDAASSKGKLVFYVYDNHGEGYSEKDVDLHPVHIVFKFTKVGNVLQGSFVKTEFGQTVTDNNSYQMDLLFRGLSDIDQSNFVEKSGSISDYRGLVYDYAADVENDAALQQTLANFSPLEELYGTTFTYTGLQATVGFNSEGGLCTGNGVTLLAKDAAGNVVVIKLNVSVGGNYLANILD